MSAQGRRFLVVVPLAAALVAWVGYSLVKRLQGPLTHAEIAGPAVVKANAGQLPGTVVTPHLEAEIPPGKNVLWCATFQVAWNELCDLFGGPVQWAGAPEMISILNKKTVTRGDLDEASYVAMAGYITEDANDIRLKIARELERKFRGAASPELLHLLDAVLPGAWATYAYLFKELPFEWAFTRMHAGLGFAGSWVENFGILQLSEYEKNEVKAASQVLVYDYQGRDDFIIKLKMRSRADRLILAKIPPARTLAETVAAVQTRLQQNEPGSMQGLTDLRVPLIDFDVLRDYRNDFRGFFGLAAQQIRFRLDERGAVLKSDAVMAAARVPGNLIFDKPFLVLIQRTDASQPYFALWVANAELLVPFK